ncbi:MAG: ABC transporter ATP-binding protein [Candidatus Omnitrophica bacterium]|nr:ABC transporter ATP-binding protein [Candidatus Omnitrophota bacterium]MBU4589765.1 ABC transporter ATP-binding protein [Candidatus Omnitrophota bacterium]
MNIIEVNNLYKEFCATRSLSDMLMRPFKKAKRKIVLNGVSLKVKNNELFCLVGPNGAGKTTLIKILCTLILPTSGSAVVNGHDVTDMDKKVRESIGFISGDERSFFWRLSCLENLRFFAVLYNIPSSRIDEEIKRVIDITGLDEAGKRFQECSTGTKQRLGIARSLLREPEVLFMDEPTRSLDPLIAANFRKFIKEELVKKHKKTVFFTTHNLNEAEVMAGRLAILDKGKIKAVGTLEELRQTSGSQEKSIEDVFSYYIGQ